MRLDSELGGDFVAIWPQIGKVNNKASANAAIYGAFTGDAIYFVNLKQATGTFMTAIGDRLTSAMGSDAHTNPECDAGDCAAAPQQLRGLSAKGNAQL